MKLSFDKKIYPLDAVLGACFTFIDRCYLLLDSDKEGKITVNIEPKQDAGVDQKTLEGEFQNELLNQVMRIKVAKKTGKLRDLIIERALIGADPSLVIAAPVAQDLAAAEAGLSLEEENLDFLDDPLGIAIPWEEKYGKEKQEEKKD